MKRPILLSNGEMAVAIDHFGGLQQLYFPYVGLENHLSNHSTEHRVGLFVDGTEHWLSDGSWDIKQDYLSKRLISKTTATNHWLGFVLEFQDFVDSELNVITRSIEIVNLTNRNRSVELFMSQAFTISEADDRRDTAQYLPNLGAILHYKGRRHFIISSYNRQTSRAFDSFSVGKFGHSEGQIYAGVWRDSEDGRLSENPVECGRTDSILQFDLNLKAHDSARVEYFLAAGKSEKDARRALMKFKSDGLTDRLLKTDAFWKKWIMPAVALSEIRVAPKCRGDFLRAVIGIKSVMDRRGAILSGLATADDREASCNTRDAVFAAMTLWKLGYLEEIKQFLRFMKDAISEEGFFEPSYRPDSLVGSNHLPRVQNGQEVLPIDTSETAAVLSLAAKVANFAIQRGDRIDDWRDSYNQLAKPAAEFLLDQIDQNTGLPLPSYDSLSRAYGLASHSAVAISNALQDAAKLAEFMQDSGSSDRWQQAASGLKVTTNAILEQGSSPAGETKASPTRANAEFINACLENSDPTGDRA